MVLKNHELQNHELQHANCKDLLFVCPVINAWENKVGYIKSWKNK